MVMHCVIFPEYCLTTKDMDSRLEIFLFLNKICLIDAK
uniref:Uncharacterized protein n=1 Tax=Rhizophora mucronata TaxID=61149 RepID=A0A2P2QJ30_RHIMU